MKNSILVISALFPPEPVVSANLSFDIASKLSETRKVTIVSPPPSRPSGMDFTKNTKKREKLNFSHITVNSFVCPDSKILGRFRESYSFGKEIAKYLEANNVEIKVIYANVWPLFSQFFLIKAAKKFKIPVLLHIQDIYPESLSKKMPRVLGDFINGIFRPLDKYILENASAVIGISLNMIGFLSKSRRVNIDKFKLVRNWQNDNEFQYEISDSDSESFTFMYLGSISSSAGVDLLIRSFHNAKINKGKLIIAGNGSEKATCIRLVEEIRNKDISFFEVTPREVAEFQNKADVLLLPLKRGISLTATPSKLTAYMLSGKPVLACVEMNSDTAEIISLSECGLISVPEDVACLSDNMIKISQMGRDKLSEMGKNAKKYAKEELSKENNLSKMVSLIEEIYDRN